jgi:hypothetical protein
MRYIPSTQGQTVVQVPENQNSYINIKGFGAKGIGDTEFSGLVTSVQSNEIFVESVVDGDGKPLAQYLNELSPGTQLQAILFKQAILEDDGIISVSNILSEGVDFSASTSTSLSLQPLKYYVWGYDVERGYLPNALQTINVGNKILDPDRWNENQYVELQFSRTNQYVIPIIYRVWGDRIDFLGGIGGEKIGFPGASIIAFRDLGLTEIPSWDAEVNIPSFLKDVFVVSGGVPTQITTLLGKELVEIAPIFSESIPTVLELTSAQGPALVSFTRYSEGVKIKFVIDDTKYIRNAIEQARSSSVKEIFFPSGVYNFRDTFCINTTTQNYSNLTFRGVGESSVIKRVSSLVSTSPIPGLLAFSGLLPSAPIQGIRFKNICLDGNSSSNFSTLPSELPIQSRELLLHIQNALNVSVAECKFQNSGGSSLFIKDSRDILLSSSIYSGAGRRYESAKAPLYLYGSQNVVAQGNIFEFSTSGPTIFSTDFSTINNNIVRSCGDKGIALESSYQWNATNNLSYSDNDSLIQSIDRYNSEFFAATLEVTRGTPLSPVYFTITDGGESVSIAKNSIEAEIFNLNSLGEPSTKVGNFRVLETFDQREAGIFSITLPGTTSATIGGLTIPATSQLQTIDPINLRYGYFYSIKASVKLGRGGRGFSPLSIRNLTIGGANYVAIRLRTSADVLSFQVYSASNPDNDKIIVSGFSNSNLSGFDPNVGYTVIGIDSDSSSLLLNPIPGLILTNQPIEFVGGELFILRSNYLVSQGNIVVH